MDEQQVPYQNAPGTDAKHAHIEAKLDAIYASVEKTRKYFLATLIISVVLFVLPLIGLLFAVPAMLENITAGYEAELGL